MARSDIEIAQAAKLRRISEVARERLGIPDDQLEPFGHYKAKISLSYLDSLRERPDGTLVLSMDVCHDWALRSWILSWGRFARVLTPAGLANELRADLQAASERYVQA